jgi:hypothetical protein
VEDKLPVFISMTVTSPNLPINNLEEFLNEAQGLLDNIVGPWSQILFEENDREPLEEAWTELRLTLPDIAYQIRDAPPHKLEEAGLSGNQLTSKLKWLSDAWKKFKEKGTVKLLKKLLEWINLILGSIAIVVPKAEALKELKEAIEKLINKGEE